MVRELITSMTENETNTGMKESGEMIKDTDREHTIRLRL